MTVKKNKLIKQYPWLNRSSIDIADYIPPQYYNELLKKYIFNDLTDLEFFEKYLNANFSSKNSDLSVLELGFGSGRATNIFLNGNYKYKSFDLVDLSKDMNEYTKKRFIKKQRLKFFETDTINFLTNTKSGYDLIFSLWSFSHSVHQHMIKNGLRKASKYINNTIEKFIIKNIRKEGKMYIIHFDTLSEEQRILIKQWKKVFPIFSSNKQSPSKKLLDTLLTDLKNKKIIDLRISHYKGKSIKYESVKEALEIFMNFHMETYFNKNVKVASVIEELIKEFNKYEKNGKIYISPGCFIYEITRK